jgi:Zn-dependent peptidase ImmA (M78 family)
VNGPRKVTDLDQYRTKSAAPYYGPQINPRREAFIRNQARTALLSLWEHLRKDSHTKIDAFSMLPFDARIVVTEINGWRYEEFEDIGTVRLANGPVREIAGILERSVKRIILAGKFPLYMKRFTLAHELGHLLLHPDLESLREAPSIGDRRYRKPLKEREADLFAAEFQMPTKMVRDLFVRRFGQPIDASSIDEEVAFYFGDGHSADELRRMQPIERAKIFASVPSLITSDSRPLNDIFGVSPIALAIQLLDLRLA